MRTTKNNCITKLNTTSLLKLSAALTVIVLAGQSSRAQHINAGALTQTQNSQLVWANGAAFAADSGYVQNMTLATSGRFTGLFNAGPTFTALSVTNGGAALGSFLTAEIVSLTGPTGGILSFWEGADQGGGSSPLFNMTAGSIGLSHRFALSDALEGAGLPGGDPYGHLHGRRFTTTTEGLYTLGIRVLDTSANGVGGGAIHMPSEVLYMNFQTVPEPSVFALVGLGLAGLWWIRRQRRT